MFGGVRLRYVVLAAFLAMVVASQVQAQEVCTGILTYLGRDVTNIRRQNSQNWNRYDRYCEGSVFKKDSATTVGLSAIVEMIPISLNVGFGSNEQKMNNFCKIYDEKLETRSAEEIDTSIVVREALEAFNQCIALSKKDIFFYPKILRTQLTIDVRRGTPDSTILGVFYDHEKMSCTVPSSVAGDTTVAADGNTRKHLTGDMFPVSCTRTKSRLPDGKEIYLANEISVATSQGSFAIPIEGDAILPIQSAADITARIDAQAEAISALNARKRSVECKVIVSGWNTGRFAQAVAAISADDLKVGFAVTGGGCERNSNSSNVVMKDAPEEDGSGWRCQNGDFPGIAEESTLRAYVTACKVAE